MQEKDMVLDVLSGTKSSISAYSTFITECNNPKLKQTFQQMRDGGEKFQYELYQMAKDKGYYTAPKEATEQELTSLKASLNAAAAEQQGSGPTPVSY